MNPIAQYLQDSAEEQEEVKENLEAELYLKS